MKCHVILIFLLFSIHSYSQESGWILEDKVYRNMYQDSNMTKIKLDAYSGNFYTISNTVVLEWDVKTGKIINEWKSIDTIQDINTKYQLIASGSVQDPWTINPGSIIIRKLNDLNDSIKININPPISQVQYVFRKSKAYFPEDNQSIIGLIDFDNHGPGPNWGESGRVYMWSIMDTSKFKDWFIFGRCVSIATTSSGSLVCSSWWLYESSMHRIETVYDNEFKKDSLGYELKDANNNFIRSRMIYNLKISEKNNYICGVDSNKIGFWNITNGEKILDIKLPFRRSEIDTKVNDMIFNEKRNTLFVSLEISTRIVGQQDTYDDDTTVTESMLVVINLHNMRIVDTLIYNKTVNNFYEFKNYPVVYNNLQNLSDSTGLIFYGSDGYIRKIEFTETTSAHLDYEDSLDYNFDYLSKILKIKCLNHPIGNNDIKIFNIQGLEVSTNTPSIIGSDSYYNLSTLSRGFYIFRTFDGKSSGKVFIID